MEHDRDLLLIDVDAWDFGDFCIGDVSVCDGRPFKISDQYLAPYIGVRDQSELAGRVRQRLERHAEEPVSGVPFMPSYTLNDLDSGALGLGVDLEGKDIYGVVRLVDHIGHRKGALDRPGACLQAPWLPFNVQIDFERKDGIDGVAPGIIATLTEYADDEESGTDDENEALKRLLARKDWKLQIWVLPYKQRKMYRFPNVHAKTWKSLEEYLSEEKVQSGTELRRALYMEAHIVPLGESEGESGTNEPDEDGDDEGAGRRNKSKGKKPEGRNKDVANGRGGKQNERTTNKAGKKK